MSLRNSFLLIGLLILLVLSACETEVKQNQHEIVGRWVEIVRGDDVVEFKADQSLIMQSMGQVIYGNWEDRGEGLLSLSVQFEGKIDSARVNYFGDSLQMSIGNVRFGFSRELLPAASE